MNRPEDSEVSERRYKSQFKVTYSTRDMVAKRKPPC